MHPSVKGLQTGHYLESVPGLALRRNLARDLRTYAQYRLLLRVELADRLAEGQHVRPIFSPLQHNLSLGIDAVTFDTFAPLIPLEIAGLRWVDQRVEIGRASCRARVCQYV